MITNTLGRNPKNDIQYNKSDISDFHARIAFDGKSEFHVEDLDSTNGTFVNGYRIKKATVSVSDEVRLSATTLINLAVLFKLEPIQKKQKKDPNDYTEEFDSLREVYDNYQRNRIRIIKKNNLKTSIIRGTFTFMPLVIFELIRNTVLGNSDSSVLAEFSRQYIIFSVMGSTIAVLATTNISPVEKLASLDEDFRHKYVCPNKKCYAQLGNIPWKSYERQGKCKCGAIYVKSTETEI